MSAHFLKILAALSVATLVTGCKLAVMVPSGGDVTSASGTRNCTGGSLCEHNITDSTFNESFTAVARPGYVFSKWNKGAGFFCGDSTNPTCTISNVGTAGNAGIEAVIASGQLFYAMPLFEFVGIDTDGDGEKDHVDTDDDNDGVLDVDDSCPLDANPGCQDILIADGKTWYQADLFTNLSWNQINAVCPAPSHICTTGGLLNGHDMTGWKWASAVEIAALFNSYGIYPPLSVAVPSGTDLYNSSTTSWATAFFEAGWRPVEVFETYRYVQGWSNSFNATSFYISMLNDGLVPGYSDRASTSNTAPSDWSNANYGAFFYR